MRLPGGLLSGGGGDGPLITRCGDALRARSIALPIVVVKFAREVVPTSATDIQHLTINSHDT